jgi:hypothetical protein
MEPVKRSDHNHVYKGEHFDQKLGRVVNKGVGDLSCFRERPGLVRGHWKPSPEELAILNAGGHVEVGVWTEPIPPLSVNAIAADEPNGGDPSGG